MSIDRAVVELDTARLARPTDASRTVESAASAGIIGAGGRDAGGGVAWGCACGDALARADDAALDRASDTGPAMGKTLLTATLAGAFSPPGGARRQGADHRGDDQQRDEHRRRHAAGVPLARRGGDGVGCRCHAGRRRRRAGRRRDRPRAGTRPRAPWVVVRCSGPRRTAAEARTTRAPHSRKSPRTVGSSDLHRRADWHQPGETKHVSVAQPNATMRTPAPGMRSGRSVPAMPTKPPACQSVSVGERALSPNATGPYAGLVQPWSLFRTRNVPRGVGQRGCPIPIGAPTRGRPRASRVSPRARRGRRRAGRARPRRRRARAPRHPAPRPVRAAPAA